MKERPILFSGAMVRALLEGRKTVTRRAMRIQPVLKGRLWQVYGAGWSDSMDSVPCVYGHSLAVACPYGQVGDRLWVRETWSDVNLSGAPGIAYRADGDVRDLMEDASFLEDGRAFNYEDPRAKPYTFACWADDLIGGVEGKWRPSIHMPRWVSRIQLEVVSVRVERLQAGEGETGFESRYLAEGINRIHHGDGEHYYHAMNSDPEPGNWCDPFDAWRELWTSINGQESWDANPWVWVVEFRRVTA